MKEVICNEIILVSVVTLNDEAPSYILPIEGEVEKPESLVVDRSAEKIRENRSLIASSVH